jgi:hypothetical protein
MQRPFTNHVLSRTVVVPERRLLFVPVPKSGCTSMLWLMAHLAGLGEEHFARSPTPEVSPALTVHDMRLWPPSHRFGELPAGERERLLAEPGWLRFTMVRHPAARLWSAWQSKLLLREPRFVEAYGSAAWFPRVPEDAGEIVEDFRRFVEAVGRGEADDVHWGLQRDIVEQLPLQHVGRLESFQATLDLVRAHVGEQVWPEQRPWDNRSLLPLAPQALDAATLGRIGERFAPDFEAYAYDREPPGGDPAAWDAQAEALLPALRASIAEHARIDQLHRLNRRLLGQLDAAAQQTDDGEAGDADPARAPVLFNDERASNFDVRWSWADGARRSGFTAVVRAKNEARHLPFVLPPLLRAVDRVVLIDNGSTDGTADVARRVAAEAGAEDRLEVDHYPFAIARCGAEHLSTSPSSVHSLAYFYNWSFAHVRTSYALKWDADMVLSEAAVETLRDLAWQIECDDVVVRVPRHPLYIADDRTAFIDFGLRNNEPWGWPNKPGYSFVKAMEWELPLWGSSATHLTLPDRTCVELKHLDADEFAHWSDTTFDRSGRNRRKRREWQIFRALNEGGELPEEVVRVESPPGVHIVDHVRTDWLPRRASETAFGWTPLLAAS